MILFFKKIRTKLLKENKIPKYLAYAFGEIILVVIGILIALQINNWNQNNIEKKSLEAYLTSLSRNIQSDLDELKFLGESRHQLSVRIPYIEGMIKEDKTLTKADITLVSETTTKLMAVDYFIPDQSGFDSLKNSGYLNKLQGQDIEFLLYRYYNLIEEIAAKELVYNDNLNAAARNFQDANFENVHLFYRPSYFGETSLRESLQPSLKKIITHQSSSLLFSQSSAKAPLLNIMYDNLSIIGKQLIRLIAANKRSLDKDAEIALKDIFNVNGKRGYAKIISNGSFNAALFVAGYAQSQPTADWAHNYINEVEYSFKEMAWGVQYLTVISEAFVERSSRDYSSYRTLRIEAKAQISGQEVFLVIKDAEDPDDGSETKVPITLTNEWQTYDIPLSKFETADLTRVYLVAGFVFLENAQTIKVRTVEYVR